MYSMATSAKKHKQTPVAAVGKDAYKLIRVNPFGFQAAGTLVLLQGLHRYTVTRVVGTGDKRIGRLQNQHTHNKSELA